MNTQDNVSVPAAMAAGGKRGSAPIFSPARQTPPPAQQVTLTSYGSLEQMFKVAEYLSRSPIVPTTFQNQPGSVLIALNLAARLNLDPFMVMQQVYVVHGRPGISGQFAIALLNKSPKYARIEFVKTGAGMKVVGHRRDGGVDEGTEITRRMVEAEGWGKNSKWQTMEEQMLRYRAAAFFARAYCPEELMGLSTVEELSEMEGADVEPHPRNVTPVRSVAERPCLPDVGGPGALPDDKADVLPGLEAQEEAPVFGQAYRD